VLDPDLHLARALLIEGNPLLRSITTSQLRDAGVGQVIPCPRVRDARLLLEREKYDIVICNREFEGSDISGQDLLDELRREQLLPYSTVFLMVTSSATYAQVVEAAESALDGFLVRPYTAAALTERLLEARQRKRLLADVMKALEAGDLETAFARALKRFQEQLPYAAYCGRLAAELLLRMGRPEDSAKVFQRLVEIQPAVWARLGLARAELASGRAGAARKIIDDILAQDPACADAQDLLGRTLVERSDFAGALQAYRAACEQTPGCLLRTQHAGALAFFLGHHREAQTLLMRARGMGVQSRLFDALSLFLLALLQYDAKDTEALRETLQQIAGFPRRYVDSRRLARLEEATRVLLACRSDPPAVAQERFTQLAAACEEEDFDIEGAQVVLCLWVRLPGESHRDAESGRLAETIGLRFCTNKAMTEFFIAAAQSHPVVTTAIRQCQARINAMAEEAMETCMAGRTAEALNKLLQNGRSTRNARLLELAGVLTDKHAAALDEATRERLKAESDTLARRYAPGVTQIAGIQRSSRSPGGLTLRR
jgi:DNA-binding response OmpR family regulator